MSEDLSLEILISTMNRKDLSFLDFMFPTLDTSRYSILIINQTKYQEDLESSYPKIRVINSREFGLSKSRNLAIENAQGYILLIADDDIQYLPDFEKTIYKAYQTYPEASLISFQFINEHKELAKLYPKREGYITSTKRPLSSVEISFRRKVVMEFDIRMNQNFGLGSTFVCSEEQLFKSDFFKENLKVAFVAKPILIHKGKSSASNLGKQESIEATTAYKFIQYNNLVYLWLFKYVFFLFRHKYVSFFGQFKAYKIGMQAVKKLKRITNEN